MSEENKTPLQGEERRRYKRYEFTSSIWLETAPGERLKRLETVNISSGGLLFHSYEELFRGATVILHIEIPYFIDLIRAECTVMHCSKAEDKDLFAVGVHLDHVDGVTKEQLEAFLIELYREQ